MIDPQLETALRPIHALATSALPRWDLPPDAQLTLINVSENITYRVDHGGCAVAVLRVHREGYHSRNAIASELTWLEALRSDGVVRAPRPWLGQDGQAIQCIGRPARHLVMFEFLEGAAPDPTAPMTDAFEALGTMAARCHLHALSWTRPPGFERFAWDLEAVFGTAPRWGDWRDGPDVTPAIRTTLEQVETRIRQRLSAYGKGPDRYTLIHADMRLANVLVDGKGPQLIDFDDCGLGWLMYDFAAAISFIEDDPRIPALKAAWLKGYQRVRPLDPADIAEIETLIMLRRLALLAWIGSHSDAPEPKALAPGFAAITARLGAAWLAGHA